MDGLALLSKHSPWRWLMTYIFLFLSAVHLDQMAMQLVGRERKKNESLGKRVQQSGGGGGAGVIDREVWERMKERKGPCR